MSYRNNLKKDDRVQHAETKRLGNVAMQPREATRFVAPARLAYFLHHGSIPEGKEICHTCDEGRCCNVKHLFPGTHLDNMRDMIAKGRARHAAGQEHERAKLTNKDVREIRRRMARRKYGDGKRIAKDFGITHNHVLDIVARRAWKHLA